MLLQRSQSTRSAPSRGGSHIGFLKLEAAVGVVVEVGGQILVVLRRKELGAEDKS